MNAKTMLKKVFPIYTEVSATASTICWPLGNEVFDFPFFNEGVEELMADSLVQERCLLKDLNGFPEEELLEVKGFIFHTSHCGSTLLSRMLNDSPNIRVVSETEAINGLLLTSLLNDFPEQEVLSRLSVIINAYRQPIGQEKYLIFKLTSWNVFLVDLFQKLYPLVKWIFIDRKTEEVVKSLLASDGAMGNWFHSSVDVLRRQFLSDDYTGTSREDYFVDLVDQHRKQMIKFKNEHLCLIEYPDFIGQFESRILSHFGLVFSAKEISLAKSRLLFQAKSYKPTPFLGKELK